MKYLKLLISLLVATTFLLNFSFAQDIEGSIKISQAPNVTFGVTYDDNMYGKYDDKFYKIKVNQDKKVIIKFDIEAGTVNQAIEYEFLEDKAGYPLTHQNDFFGSERYDTHFEDSFNADSGNYVLKISKYSSRFLGDYSFELTYDCQDKTFSEGERWVCENGIWVDKTIRASNKDDTKDDLQDDTVLCEGCLVDNVCYDIGFIQNQTYCSNTNLFVNQKDAGKSCTSNYECLNNECLKGECKKPGFFTRLFQLLKDLF